MVDVLKIEQSKNIVFLMGAGASVAFGPPLMRDFMVTARTRYFELLKRKADHESILPFYEKMFAFHEKCRHTLWAFDRDWDNVEELYTQADLLRLANLPSPKEAEELCQSIAWVIWDVCRVDDVSEFDSLGLAMGRVRNSDMIPIIVTTNYDLTCEWQVGLKCYYPGFELTYDQDIVKLSSDALIPFPHKGMGDNTPIIKLHGSVNWFAADEHHIADVKMANYGPANRHSEVVESSQRRYMGVYKHVRSPRSLTPAIIPPMLGKSSNDRLFALQWEAAIKAISNAAQIWVMGYSFPTTDAFMSRLLTEGIMSNQDFRRLTVVDIVR